MSELQEMVRNAVKESFQENLTAKQETNDEQVDESVLALAGIVMAAGASWAWLRSFSKKSKTNAFFNAFVETYDTHKIISKKIPDMLRKFKLVNSLDTLDKMDKDVSDMIKELERMSKSNIDKFVDDSIKGEASFLDKALALNPQKEKIRLKKDIKELIDGIKDSFERDIEIKRDEFLG
jgi:hypothetical protein